MKRQLMFGTMLSAALAVGVGAQQPPASGAGSPASPQTPSERPAPSAQSMTVTGCLQAGSDAAGGGAAAGGAATTGAPAAGGQARGGFILTNVTPAGSRAGGSTTPGATAPGSATGTTGGATGTSGSAARSTYRLTGGDSQNLQQYVGQKVEVTGSIAGGSGGGASSAPSSTAPGAAGSTAAGSTAGSATSGSSSGQGGQAFRVASVRPTGERCSQ
jgi:hypothetical protein